MKTLLVILLFSSQYCFATDVPNIDPKTSQILTAILHDVITGEDNKRAREFYGTEGDRTVILLNGSGLDGKPLKWHPEFKPEIKGYTFVIGHQDKAFGSAKHNRRLAIRLDRLSLNPKKIPEEKKHVFWDKSPIRISIQNAGGSKNGAVMGGQTTWYSIVKKKTKWSVKFDGALD